MTLNKSLPPYDEALAAILASVRTVGIENLSVRQCLGRVLAGNVRVPQDMPDAPRSAVDGFAIQSDSGPTFKVVEEVRAGILPTRTLQPGEAASIMTGAVVPAGADCIAMLEVCQFSGDQVTVNAKLKAGDLINPIGDEVKAGHVFARPGTAIGPAAYPAFFAAGIPELPVHHQLRVGLLVSGDEVREVEDGPALGQVFNTNRYIIEGVCAGLGMPIVAAHRVNDDEASTRKLLDEMAAQCDVIITSGGVSRGKYDHLGQILREDPYELTVCGTAVKPGKPMHVARHPEGAQIFGMPGYPSSLLTNAFIYLVPALKKMAGRRDHAVRWFPVALADEQRYRPGRTYFNRVSLELRDGNWLAHDPGSQMSSHFLNFAQCQGLVRMPTEKPVGHVGGAVSLRVGTVVHALDFGWELS